MVQLSRASFVRLIFVSTALAVLSGCVATGANVNTIDRLAAIDTDEPKVLVMTPDVKYYLLTAGGQPQPQAEWTEAARKNFANALQAHADERGTKIQMLGDPDELGEAEIAYQKLYSAVGSSIQIHHTGVAKLPTKNNSFDWGLGPDIKVIGEKYDAEYALFSYYRDYQASCE